MSPVTILGCLGGINRYILENGINVYVMRDKLFIDSYYGYMTSMSIIARIQEVTGIHQKPNSFIHDDEIE